MKINIIELGGTISCASILPTSEFYSGPTLSVSSIVTELAMDQIDIQVDTFSQKISHEITLEDMLALAKRLQSIIESDRCDGVVITTGTNAIEDIAYFVGLTVKTEKPIVFTGAHFPNNSLFFDGKKNLYNAIKIASSYEANKLGVLVTFNDYVVTARDASKTKAGLQDNFTCEGDGIVGHVIGGKFKIKAIPTYRHTYQSEFNINEICSLKKISIIYAHLGMDDLFIRASISANISGIVSAGFGKGYQSKSVTSALFNAANLGIPVVRCSRTGIAYTSTDFAYDDKYGFIVAKGLSPHKSSVLLSLSLTIGSDLEWLRQVFEAY